MGSAYGAQQTPSNSSYKKNKWRAYIEFSVSATSATTQTVSVTLYFNGASTSWGQVGKYVSGGISIEGVTVASFAKESQSWTFSGGNKKVLSGSRACSRTTAARNVAVSGWVKVNSPSAYRNGSTSTASSSQSIAALQYMTVTFHANGATYDAALEQPVGDVLTSTNYYYNQGSFNTYGLPDYNNGGTWDLRRKHYTGTGYWIAESPKGSRKIEQNQTYSTTQALYNAATGATWAGTANTSLHLYAEWELDTVNSKVKIDGAWYDCIFWTKLNSKTLHPCDGFVKIDGDWKRIILLPNDIT